MIKPHHFLLVALLLAATSAISGYFVGERRGITKGAQMGAGLAVSFLDNEMVFLLMLETHLSEGHPDVGVIKEQMINKIEVYPVSKAFLAAPPFDQTGGLSFDQETIDDAIERLRTTDQHAEHDEGGKASPATS